MKLRPCIDIHNGKVKQIVGGSLKDEENTAKENFSSLKDAAFYAGLYRERGLSGGHIIMLDPAGTDYYEEDKKQLVNALSEYPLNMQAGGGITPENAAFFLDKGASHVIVTSYVFKDGLINERNLERIKSEVGKERLVLDLSCRMKNDRYYIVTDRWQRFTDTELTPALLEQLSSECDEFLIHAADVEGLCGGIEDEVVRIASKSPVPITYAGGIKGLDDIEKIKKEGAGRVDFTVGSALSIFGGALNMDEVIKAAS